VPVPVDRTRPQAIVGDLQFEIARVVAHHDPGRGVAVGPQRSAPAAMTSSSASSVRTPWAAFTLTRGDTLARMSRMSSTVAPVGAS
jgi:hypothetical protein